MMDYESLSNLKYSELYTLAKSKLGAVKRLNKERLVQKLLKAIEGAEQSTDHSSVEEHCDVEITTKSTPSKNDDGEAHFLPDQASSPANDAEVEAEKPSKARKSKRRGAKRAKNAKKETEPTESPQQQEPGAEKIQPQDDVSKVEPKESPKLGSPVVVIKRLSIEESTGNSGSRSKRRKRRRGTVKKAVNEEEEQSLKIGGEPPDEEPASPPKAATTRSSPRLLTRRSPQSGKRTSPRKLNGTFQLTEPSPVKSPSKPSSGAEDKTEEEKVSDEIFDIERTPTQTRAKKRSLPDEDKPEGSKLDGTFEVSPTSALSSKRRKVTHSEQPPATPSVQKSGSVAAKGKVASNLSTPGASKRLVAKTPATRNRESQIPRFVNYVRQREQEQNVSNTRSQKKSSRAAPNFAEIHQRQFDKMESVNDYVSKKQQRLATLTASTAKARSVAQQTREVMDQVKKRIVHDVTFDKRKSDAIKNDSSFQPVLNLTDVKLNFASGSSLKCPKFTAKGVVAQHKQTTVEALGRSPGKMAKTKLAKPVGRTSPRKSTQKPQAHQGLQKPVDSKVNNNKSLMGASMHDSRSVQRTIIKGVRTNRRFELQMQRRGLM